MNDNRQIDVERPLEHEKLRQKRQKPREFRYSQTKTQTYNIPLLTTTTGKNDNDRNNASFVSYNSHNRIESKNSLNHKFFLGLVELYESKLREFYTNPVFADDWDYRILAIIMAVDNFETLDEMMLYDDTTTDENENENESDDNKYDSDSSYPNINDPDFDVSKMFSYHKVDNSLDLP